MKLISLVSFLSILTLSAQLRITEVMSDSTHSDSDANGDWFEITNTGVGSMNIAGFSFDDDSAIAGTSGPLPAFLLPAGASVIILDEDDTAPFRNTWNLPASLRIISRLELTEFPSFRNIGDSVNLYNPAGNLIDSFSFGPSTEGSSFPRFTDSDAGTGRISINNFLEAYQSNDSSEDTGSPGLSQELPPPLPPFFTGPTSTAAVANTNVAIFAFRILSIDPNPSQLIFLSATGLPPWLSLNDLGGGVANLSGVPPTSAVGNHEFLVTATDNLGNSVSQTYSIDILSDTSPIILNEYNAVAPSQFLGGGDQDDPDGSSDLFFGRIAGNGGPWVEFAITQTTDLRNWTLEITNEEETRILRLSDHIALSAIPAGTILTFTESNQVIPTSLNQTSLLNSAGYTWSNIWMHDPILIDQDNSSHPDNPAITSANTTFTWRNATDEITYGPAGESVALRDSDNNGRGDSLISVGNSETFRLEASADSSINPLDVNYDDAGSSTFGSPNVWSNNTMTQDFAASIAANTPPSFDPISTTKAVRGEYIVDITHTAAPVTIINTPPFLDITSSPGVITISNNRPLSFADIGKYEITLSANNGATNYLVYELEVANPTPALILNEFNAVAPDRFLNGGTLTADNDGGPTSMDSHFGRIIGNGGNWFELALIGDGNSGFTNLTGWSIEVGQIANSGLFIPESTITLSDPATWSAVAHGTLLTFIDENTAGGGLDTQINLVNELTSDGFAWTNIHLGTPGTVTATGLSELNLNSNNTALLIRNASGTTIFGPVGEGIAPINGISSEEIFELENDPLLTVSTCDESSDSEPGYDDGSSSSTFGSPNLFAPIGSATDRAQDFSNFTLSPLQAYFINIGIPGADPAADADGDGFTNLEEYLFGGNATNSALFPQTVLDFSTNTVTATVRVNDPNFTLTAERSSNLINWLTDNLTTIDTPSPLGANFVTRTITFQATPGLIPRMFFRFNSQP